MSFSILGYVKRRKWMIYIFIAFLMLSVSGCNDILNQSPKASLSKSTFWNSENDARLALAGVYSVPSSRSWRGARGPLILDAVTNNGVRTSVTSVIQLFSNELLANDLTVRRLWSASYKQIAKCNRFLHHIDEVEMNEHEKSK